MAGPVGDVDEMAILLQDAVSELKESRKQVDALMEQNQQLMSHNSDLTGKVKDFLAGNAGRRHKALKTEVSVHTKVK